MKKKFFAIVAALALVAALPVVAFAAPSSQGGPSASGSSNGTSVTVAAGSGTGNLYVEASSTQANNAVTVDAQMVASFHVYKDGDVEPPYSFSYNVGSKYAGYIVNVYIQHDDNTSEVVSKTVASDGSISFTTDKLSIHTVVVTNQKAASGSSTATTDKSSTSPQTGLDTNLVLAGTICALVAAAGVTVAIRKQVNE